MSAAPEMIANLFGKRHVAITKSNSTTYDPPLKGVYVGGTGDVAMQDIDGTAVTWIACPAGFVIPLSCNTKVLSTGTSATNLVGVY